MLSVEPDNETIKSRKKVTAHKVFRVDISVVPDPQIFTKGRVSIYNMEELSLYY